MSGDILGFITLSKALCNVLISYFYKEDAVENYKVFVADD